MKKYTFSYCQTYKIMLEIKKEKNALLILALSDKTFHSVLITARSFCAFYSSVRWLLKHCSFLHYLCNQTATNTSSQGLDIQMLFSSKYIIFT